MKILVLMPLDEKFTYISSAVYSALEPQYKDVCFDMPNFMNYLVTTKIVPNFTHAVFDSLLAVKNLYKASEDKDLIILGNIDKSFKFDKVFNLQDIEEALPYEDKLMEKIREIVHDEPILNDMVKNLYRAEDSSLQLKNCIASADLISAYMKTDPHLEQIKKNYEEKINELKKEYGRNIHNKG